MDLEASCLGAGTHNVRRWEKAAEGEELSTVLCSNSDQPGKVFPGVWGLDLYIGIYQQLSDWTKGLFIGRIHMPGTISATKNPQLVWSWTLTEIWIPTNLIS